MPYVFPEQGIAMLSSVLNSERAIQVNIQIMRIFTKLREIVNTHKNLARKIKELERRFGEHDDKFVLVFEALKELLNAPDRPPGPKEPIGFCVRRPH